MHMMMRLVLHNHRDNTRLLTPSSGISTHSAVPSGTADDITPIKKKQYGHKQARYLIVYAKSFASYTSWAALPMTLLHLRSPMAYSVGGIFLNKYESQENC
jgi:hypothetical protein